MENLTGGTPPVRYLPCVVPCKLYFAQGKLYQHCAETENQAQQLFDTLVKQLKESEGITEWLKEQKQFEWIQKMRNIQHRAEEIVINELIYV